ncbi:MAG: hypothetical protein A2X23_06760 [Chloroflexi bacterium GWC2_73_18]|nr:MAG: hypothetical protein A2X23_06760 [Chloroflexi bacterium GWC2_73_18]
MTAEPGRTLVCRPAGSAEELRAHYAIREEAFVREQGLFAESDVDEFDDDPGTLHIVAICQPAGDVVGAVRCFRRPDGTWFGGRLAVAGGYRGTRLRVAPALVKTAEDEVRRRGARVFLAYIQPQNVRFFEHVGWVGIGEMVEYAGVPHRLMRAGWSEEPGEGA